MDLPTPADLRRRRLDANLTQSELAAAADVSQPLIARIEGGDVDPRLSTLRRIVNALAAAESEVIRATELMTDTVVAVAPDESLHVAVERMDEQAYSQLPVLTDGIPVGSISQSDLVDVPESARSDPVREHMAESFPTVAPDSTLDEVRSLLDHYTAVIVTDGGTAVGVITEADIATRLS